MPAYSFKERFVPMILDKTKRQTIRKKRKGQAKPGSTVYLYFGMRTKWCRKLGEEKCTAVRDIVIKRNGSVFVNGRKLTNLEKDTLAYNDGFRNDTCTDNPDTHANCFKVMFRWWNQTHSL